MRLGCKEEEEEEEEELGCCLWVWREKGEAFVGAFDLSAAAAAVVQ
jgi:hypothetical protein